MVSVVGWLTGRPNAQCFLFITFNVKWICIFIFGSIFFKHLPRLVIRNLANRKQALDEIGYHRVMFGIQLAYLGRLILYRAMNHRHIFEPIPVRSYFFHHKLTKNLVRYRNGSMPCKIKKKIGYFPVLGMGSIDDVQCFMIIFILMLSQFHKKRRGRQNKTFILTNELF